MNARVTNGVNGGAIYADTSLHSKTGNSEWAAVQMLSDTVFTTLTGNLTGYAGVTFAAGTIIYGRFQGIKLASGSVIAYEF